MKHNLLGLNDDCLTKIFEYLSVHELADIASTCTRFRTIARDVFSRRHKPNCLKLYMEVSKLNGCPATRQQMAATFRNFGDLLTKLEVFFFFKDEKEETLNTIFVNLMVKYCTGTIESFELRLCECLQPHKIIDAAALFRNVKELALNNSLGIDSSFLTDAKQLIRLRMNVFCCKGDVQILSNEYPKLQSLALGTPYGARKKFDIVPFLKRHPNVFELELHQSTLYDLSSIGECHWLRKLKVGTCAPKYIAAIAQLDKLTALRLEMDYEHDPLGILKATKSAQTLEELVVQCTDCHDSSGIPAVIARFIKLMNFSVRELGECNDQLLDGLHCLKNLRMVSMGALRLSLTSDGLVDLVRHLPDLEELYLYPTLDGDQRLDLLETTYLKICEIYRNRNQKMAIYNFEITDEVEKEMERREPFAGLDQHEFVQFISLADPEYDDYRSVKI